MRNVVVAFAVLFTAGWVAADTPSLPRSYSVTTANGQYIFVMLAPGTLDGETRRLNAESAAVVRDRAAALRQKYPTSGLYRTDGPPVPLWTVDWYSSRVHPASDGIHLVEDDSWASSLDSGVFTFFANGQPVRTYTVRELVDMPWQFERSASHIFWRKSARFDDARLEYTVATRDGNRFVFDVRTGDVVSEYRQLRVWLGAATALLVAAAVGLLVWNRRRRKRGGST